MIENMNKYSFILVSSEKEAFLQDLQELGLVDVKSSAKPVDEQSIALLAECNRLKAEIKDIEAGSDAHLKDLQSALAEQVKECDNAKVWGSWDRALLAQTGVELHFFKTEAKRFSEANWEADYAIAKVNDDSKTVWFVVAGSAEGFPLKELPSPSQTYSEAKAAVEEAQKQVDLYSKDLQGRKKELPRLRKELACAKDKLARYLAGANCESAVEDRLVVLEGFAPASQAATLKTAFDKMPLVWFATKATTEDKPPIKFKNKKLVSLFEVLTDMYGRPSYDGFDPTPFISIFFSLFFAFCMGDAGYGLVVVALAFLLRSKLGKQTSTLLLILGTCTVVIGFIFHSFFSLDISQWGFIRAAGLNKIMVPSDSKCVVSGMGEYDWTMMLALVCGVVHICIAQCTKAIVETRNKGVLGSVSTWGWTLLIVGGVAVGTFALLGVMNSAITKIAIIVIGIVSALCIFLLRDFHKNPLSNVGSGLWEAYNTATGLLSDVLSYLRLYALGLAGGLLGGAFNDLAVMVRGDGGFGWVFFVLLVLVGHVLNIAMSGLSAFVHPLRLNFLEFFKNSGYEGAGRKYTPLAKDNSNN